MRIREFFKGRSWMRFFSSTVGSKFGSTPTGSAIIENKRTVKLPRRRPGFSSSVGSGSGASFKGRIWIRVNSTRVRNPERISSGSKVLSSYKLRTHRHLGSGFSSTVGSGSRWFLAGRIRVLNLDRISSKNKRTVKF